FEIIHFDQSIRRGGMPFGETGHPNSETRTVWMRSGFVESANEFDQIDRVLKRVPRFIVSNPGRPVAAKRKNVYNSPLRMSEKDCLNLLFVVTDTGQVRDRVKLCCVLNALDKIVS